MESPELVGPLPQPAASLEEAISAFDSVPLFMKTLPEDSMDDPVLNALQSLAYEGTPDEIAQNFKEQGNDYFKGKRHREALGFYTQGIDAKPEDKALLEALLCNRAACNLALKNYGSVLKDCSKALTINPKSSKAYFRSASALVALDRIEEGLDCCDRCLEHDPDNAIVRDLRNRAAKLKEAKDKKEAERLERIRKEKEEERKLHVAFQQRNLITVKNPVGSADNPYRPHFDPEDPTGQTLIMPTFFLYPQYATSDVIPHFVEDTPFAAHITAMFPPSAPAPDWDKKGEYVDGNLAIYAITNRKRLLKVGKTRTLRDIFAASKAKDGEPKDGLEVKDGYLTFVVLLRGDVEKNWVEEFKRSRETHPKTSSVPAIEPGDPDRARVGVYTPKKPGPTLKMSVQHKILRTANAPTTSPDETETAVAQALIDLENGVPELKTELRPLQISAAREVDVRGGKKAIIIFVPVPQLKAFHKVQQRLTRELEKKFSDRHVVFVAQRRMLRKPTRTSRVKQKRPRSRTLTSVHEKILEDLVFPTEIVGKRTRVSVDGSKLLKVFLDAKDATSLEYKLDSFSSVYRRLTGKDVVFEFPVQSDFTKLPVPPFPHFPFLSPPLRVRHPYPLVTTDDMEEYPRMDPYMKARYDQGVDAKIVIMGNTGVGKTSLLHRYTQNKFDPKNTTSTTGAFFVTKKVYVDGIRVRLQLWDTAGQERFRSMAPMYYRGANAALLLYDITNAATFDDVRGWLEELKKNCSPDLIIYIVGSKADLYNHRQVTSDLARLSLHNWFPPPRPPSPSPPPPPPPSSTFSYIRPRFTSFTSVRSVPLLTSVKPSLTPSTETEDSQDSRSSGLTRSTTSPHFTRPRAKSGGLLLPHASATGVPTRNTQSRFGSHFGVYGAPQNGWQEETSSNSLQEDDEDETDSREWGLEKGMELFEVSAKDDTGISHLFNSLISAIIIRKDIIERENDLKRRDSVFLSTVSTPTWSAQADEEEAREKEQLAAKSSWSCCSV
ncbi:ribosomal protein S7e-domain-containing protein [Cristinia sonorae]|uniref:Ribosomal protein S7e-domain-containing protein n=1 Tax=Cristinia sonorae TaxID=1940300 RepID=A0A8K0UXB9_9AGAR|nr:ribosomal protein S7e-domain-containing protein [Cristinia sonorae]